MTHETTMHTPVFRMIALETRDAFMNMALDEACMEAVLDGNVAPTIRFYRWSTSAISIGNFQCLRDEVDITACAQDNVPIVRRETGGGAVYHDQDGEVTYSIIAPVTLFPNDITDSYREICSCIVASMNTLGITATFRPINDLVVAGKKISGNAQTRKGGILLQHGTILLSLDTVKMFRYLTPDKSKLSDKPFTKSVQASVTSVFEHANVSREQVEQALHDAFTTQYACERGEWSPEELARAQVLVREKYGTKEWNEKR